MVHKSRTEACSQVALRLAGIMNNLKQGRRFLNLIGVFVFSISLAAEGTAQEFPREGESPQSNDGRLAVATAIAADESYRIGPGDVLDVVVSKQPDYSRSGVRVDNNGMIQISRDDVELKAACKTVREVANEIKDRYRRYLRNPYVYVEVKEFQSQPVAVIGAVNAPGRFQLQRRVRLLELLTFVNGPSERAGGSIQIIRTSQGALCDPTPFDSPETAGGDILIAYNLKDTLKAEEGANPYVRPGDIIRISDAEQAYIIGAVKNSAPVLLKEPVTLSEAIARAGGLAPGANGEKIRIVRQVNGTTTKTEIIANLKAINQRQKEDILLQANDIVAVPGPSGAKKFLNGLMRTIVPGLTSYPLGVIR
jgi:polysaccharide export outer membrane protein